MQWTNTTFEWKHHDERILHFWHPARIQTFFEALRIIAPTIVAIIFLSTLGTMEVLSPVICVILGIIIGVFGVVSTLYKIYRSAKNYFIVTNKRLLFHGMDGFLKEYVKKVPLENVVNVNFFTHSLVGRFCGYGNIEVQTSHSGAWDMMIYHMNHAKMLAHYIDKVCSLSPDERLHFGEFDPNYFVAWKK